MAIVLSTPKVPPAKARNLIDHYSPNLSSDDESTWRDHNMLYIRCMRPEQVATMLAYRKKVLGWYDLAMELQKWIASPTMDWISG